MTATSTRTESRAASAKAALDVEAIRRDFPALHQQVHGKPLVYLDNAATTHKPSAVIDAISDFYRQDNSNVHRGLHALSERATAAFEHARDRIGRFINAAQVREVIFTRGTTEAINLVAQSYGRDRLRRGDEVLITHLEHHSNIVPWQIVTQQTGATLKVVPINDRGELIFEAFEKLLTERTRIVALGHVSNALGTVNPVKRIVERAHAAGAVVVVDGAQATPHLKVDVQELGCDFYAFSGHKMFGPTGIGVLWGRVDLLEKMPPYQGGGDMIKSVTFEKTLYNDLPYKFEAGTPNIAGVIGLGAAVDYLDQLDFAAIASHEHDLVSYASGLLGQERDIRLIGTAAQKAAVISFVLEGIHPHDIGTILDRQGVAIRTGHHCAQPVMERFGVPATARASLALYNRREDLDALVKALHKVRKMFAA